MKLSPLENFSGSVIGLITWLKGVRGLMTVIEPSALETRLLRASTEAL